MAGLDESRIEQEQELFAGPRGENVANSGPAFEAGRWFRARGEDGSRCRLFHRLQPAMRLRLPSTVC